MSIKLNYKDMSFNQLNDTINELRQELLYRGTVTRFNHIHHLSGEVMKTFDLMDIKKEEVQ